jgi:hypothetical protein
MGWKVPCGCVIGNITHFTQPRNPFHDEMGFNLQIYENSNQIQSNNYRYHQAGLLKNQLFDSTHEAKSKTHPNQEHKQTQQISYGKHVENATEEKNSNKQLKRSVYKQKTRLANVADTGIIATNDKKTYSDEQPKAKNKETRKQKRRPKNRKGAALNPVDWWSVEFWLAPNTTYKAAYKGQL